MARLWFYNIPYHGHINVTLPLIQELVQRGDEVTYFSGAAFADKVEATGAIHRVYENSEAFAQTRQGSHAIHQGKLVAESTHALLPEVFAAIEADPPDYLMFDMSAPWAGIAGRRYNIPALASFPHLPFYWRMVSDDGRVFSKLLASVKPGEGHWRELRKQTLRIIKDFNLRKPADINVLSSSAELNIVFSSRYFQPYSDQFDDSYYYVGPEVDTQRPEKVMVINKGDKQKLIYIAVSTVYEASLSFFKMCIEALADENVAVIMSVGKAIDPADLGEIPPNFTAVQYAPQLQILQQADLFVTHGGMNSINEAITFGVPMVVIPNTIEQTVNAARVEELGAGRFLPQDKLTAVQIRETAVAVLNDSQVQPALEKIRISFAEAGGVQRAADAIEVFKKKHGLN